MDTLTRMRGSKQTTIKEQFAERLNRVLDESPLNVPVKGDGRQVFVAKLFRVNQKAARKWLEGDGFPKLEKCIEISLRLDVAIEWLLTGRGDMRMIDKSDKQLAELLNQWFQMPEELRVEVVNYSKFLVGKITTDQLPPGKSPDTGPGSTKKTH